MLPSRLVLFASVILKVDLLANLEPRIGWGSKANTAASRTLLEPAATDDDAAAVARMLLEPAATDDAAAATDDAAATTDDAAAVARMLLESAAMADDDAAAAAVARTLLDEALADEDAAGRRLLVTVEIDDESVLPMIPWHSIEDGGNVEIVDEVFRLTFVCLDKFAASSDGAIVLLSCFLFLVDVVSLLSSSTSISSSGRSRKKCVGMMLL